MLGTELTLPILIAAALADSINPCVFGVLIFLIAFMSRVFKTPRAMILGGLFYTFVVYVTYLAIGFGILKITVSFGFSQMFYWIAALIAIIAGLLEIKDYFWYGRGFSLQMLPGAAARLKKWTAQIEKIQKKKPWTAVILTALLGVFVVLVELPCTGAPYLAVLALLSAGDYVHAIPLLLLYNLIFILPLLVIIGIAYFGTHSHVLEKWREEHRGIMRLGIGLFLIALGAFMIYSISVV